MKIGILGSGFGLYGYLPALLHIGETVVMPARYRERLLERDDVRRHVGDVVWEEDESAVLLHCEALVVSRRPTDQVEVIQHALAEGAASRFLLEKPIASTPGEAFDILTACRVAEKAVAVGFTFRYTLWAERVASWIASAGPGATLSFEWRFSAHHFRIGVETWKRRPSQGGGVLRFYAIHLIALLAELGYRGVTHSRLRGDGADDARGWESQLQGEGLPLCSVSVACDATDTVFSVVGSDAPSSPRMSIALSDPFGDAETVRAGLDPRVDVLSKLCGDFVAGPHTIDDRYFASVELWAAAEALAGQA